MIIDAIKISPEASGATSCPLACVVISTRNRGALVAAAIKSVLENDYANFELRVIDQSDNNQTEEAVQPFLDVPRFFYTRTTTRGLSNGRNLAIGNTGAEFIAITDDDCVVAANWISEIVGAFQENPAAGIVIGKLVPAEYDPATGYIPCYLCDKPYVLKSTGEDIEGKMGWGGCMAIRRSVWQTINGFDPGLGPGAQLKSAEDRDFSFRALAKGYFIYFKPEISVTHYGFRKNGAECRALAYRERFGSGAHLAKHLKLGNRKVVSDELKVWHTQVLIPFLRNLVFKRSAEGAVPVVAFWMGVVAGLFKRVNHQTGIYRVQAG